MTPIEIQIRTSATLQALEAARREVQALRNDTAAASTVGAQFAQRLSSGMGGVLAALAPVALSIAGITGALVAGVTAGINYNATLEQQTVAFRTLLGSMDAAQARMEELAAFAATTPFELPELVNASRILQSLAGDELGAGDGLRLVGDAAAATGRGFEEMAMWVGRVYAGLKSGTPVGEATLRLIEMGAISGETARMLNHLAESGAATNRPFEVLRQTFSQFDGAMALQGETLKGLTSTLKDTVKSDLGEITSSLTEQLRKLVRAILEAKGAITSRPEAVRQQLQGSLNAFGQQLDGARSEEGLRKVKEEITAERQRVAAAVAEETATLQRLRPFVERGIQHTQPGGNITLAEFNQRVELLRDQVKYSEELGKIETAAASDAAKRLALERAQREQPAGPSKEEAARILEIRKQAAELGSRNAAQEAELRFEAMPAERQLHELSLARQQLDERALELNRLALTGEVPRHELDLRRAQLKRDQLEVASRMVTVEARLQKESEETAEAITKAKEEEAERRKEKEKALDAAVKELETMRQQQFLLDLQLARSDWRSTPGQQRDAQLGLGRAALGSGTIGTGDMALLENSLGPDPRSFEESWTAMLVRLRAENEAWAGNFTNTLGNIASSGIDQISNGLAGAVLQTSNWRQELSRIPLVVGREIVAAIIKMGIQWIATRLSISAVEKSSAGQEAAAKAPVALMDSISSYGIAALVGAAAFVAAMALAGGFASGGETPGVPTLAWVGEKGSELVIPAHVNSRLNPAQKSALVGGNFEQFSGGTGSGAPQSIAFFDDRQAMRSWMREHGEAEVIDIMQRNWHRFG